MSSPALRLATLLCLLLAGGCSRLLFLPMEPLVRTPADVGMEYRDVMLEASDGTRLAAWWLPAQEAAKGTVFFLHGNAENISTHLASVHWLPAEGYQVLLLDYRGYGDSTGTPRLPDVFADLQAAADWLEDEAAVSGLPLYLLGQSLGASLGGRFVGDNPAIGARFSGVILDAGFARYRWIAREVATKSWISWSFQWPIAWSMPRKHDLLDRVGDISPVPLMLIHGRGDRIVDYHHAEDLFAAARRPRLLISHDGPHIASLRDPAIRRTLLRFLEDPSRGCEQLEAAECRE